MLTTGYFVSGCELVERIVKVEKKKAPFTNFEKDYIAKHYKHKSVMELASFLGRTPKSIEGYLTANRIHKTPNWTNWEKLFLQNNYKTMPVAEIAKRVNRTINAVKIQISRTCKTKHSTPASSCTTLEHATPSTETLQAPAVLLANNHQVCHSING